jgi:hypothetical protein
MPFFIFIPALIALTEVVEAVAVVGAIATTAYAGARTIEAATSSSSSSSSCGNSVRYRTLYDWWGNGISSEERRIILDRGHYDGHSYTLEYLEQELSNHYLEKAPGKPTKDDGFEPEKGWDGKTLKREPNGKRRGYPAKDGGVWVPTGEGSGDGSSGPHGGAHWDVEYPNGGHENKRPKKK